MKTCCVINEKIFDKTYAEEKYALNLATKGLLLLLVLIGSGTGCSSSTFQEINLDSPDSLVVLNVELGAYVKKIENEDNGDFLFNYEDNPEHRYSRYKISPGSYRIRYGSKHHKIARLEKEDSVILKPGHIYEVRTVACYLGDSLAQELFFGALIIYMPLLWPSYISEISHTACHTRSYQATIWIEDESEGKVVSGEKW
jgi:hypothetical protein